MNELKINTTIHQVLMKTRGLTSKEAVISEFACRGFTNKEIARKIHRTEKTVKFHLTRVYKKLDVVGRQGLLKFCQPYLEFNERGQK